VLHFAANIFSWPQGNAMPSKKYSTTFLLCSYYFMFKSNKKTVNCERKVTHAKGNNYDT
jgi:hypothetical protein